MTHTTKRRLPSTATLLAELRELRQDVAQLTARLVAADGDDAVPAGGLRPYTVGEHDCRYLSAESLQAALPQRHKIRDQDDAKGFCEEHFEPLMQRGLQEEFHIVTLDGSHHVIRTHQITIGLVNQTQVHPREAFRPAILDAAVAVLLVHNHPSGDPTPSPSDIKLTRFLMDAGKQIGISVLDHIIVAKHGTTSLTEAVPQELGL